MINATSAVPDLALHLDGPVVGYQLNLLIASVANLFPNCFGEAL